MDRTVTITVVSCDGVVAKRYESKTKKKLKNRQVSKSPTSLVASFIRGNSFQTHVPSMPMEQLDTLYMKPGKTKAIPQPLVRWHGTDGMDAEKGGDATVDKELSTLRFTRRFLQYTGTLLPEIFPLNLSLSSGGKLIPMGKAEIIVTGNEKGDSYIDVPITTTIKKVGVSNPIKKSSDHIPMVKVKGDDLQFGLKGDSVLRVILSVTDVQEQDVINDVQEDAYVHQETEDVTTDDTTLDELDDNYGSFLVFLNEESDDHDYASDLSYESDRLANADDVNKAADPHSTGELPTLQLIDEEEVSEDEEKATDVCCLWERLVSSLVSKPAALVETASVVREETHGNVEA